MAPSLLATSSAPRSNGSSSHSTRAHTMARTTAYFAGVDANLQMGLIMVFCLYLLVTVGTFSRLPGPMEQMTGGGEGGGGGTTLENLHATRNLVQRAKVLLHGKMVDTATTSDALKQLIQQQEDQQAALVSDNNNNEGEGHGAAQAAAAANDAAVVQVDMVEIAKVKQQFPIRASADMEEIEHPGLKYADMNKFNGAQPPRTMMVPKYWNPKAAYGGDVRRYLGDYGKRLITQREALTIGSKTADNKETIYITIASYRDPECPRTIDSIFKRAKFPHRLKIAVIDQRLEEDPRCIVPTELTCEQDPTQTLCKYADQIEALEMDARLGIGPVFARHLGYRHYRGEYFAMQVDAHVRFTEHWDESLVDQWKSAANEMAVLTTYLSDLNNSIDPVTNLAIRPGRPIMCATDYEGSGKYKHLRHGTFIIQKNINLAVRKHFSG